MPASDLIDRMERLALVIADQLLDGETGFADRIDGLKALTAYYTATMRQQKNAAGVEQPSGWRDAINRIGDKRNATAN